MAKVSRALADAVDPVLGLPVVGGHPVEVVEHDVGAGGQGDADPGGVEVADEHPHRVVGLESIDGSVTGDGVVGAGEGDAGVAEPFAERLDDGGVRGEHDDLLAVLDAVGDEVGGGAAPWPRRARGGPC